MIVRRALCALVVGAMLTTPLACSQIKVTREVEIIPKKGARPAVLAAPTGQVTKRGSRVEWTQRGDRLEVALVETRLCTAVLHEPVTRVEKVIRKTNGIYWEYSLAAATLAVAIVGFARPELFSPSSINAEGNRVHDKRAGYRIAGVFTGLSAVLLGAGIYDTIRARDSVHRADAYRVQMGDEVECAAPRAPMTDRAVQLVAGDWTDKETSDEAGLVQFVLPAELDRKPPPPVEPEPVEGPAPAAAAEPPDGEAPPPEEPVAPEPEIRKAVLQLGGGRAVTIDYVVPFASTADAPHTGATNLAPKDREAMTVAESPDEDEPPKAATPEDSAPSADADGFAAPPAEEPESPPPDVVAPEN